MRERQEVQTLPRRGYDLNAYVSARRAEPGAVEFPPPIVRDAHRGLGRGILHAIYDLLWVVAAIVGAPWLALRCARAPGFRAMVRERLRPPAIAPPGPGERPRVLVHGVSVGEIKAALALVRALERDRPDLEVVLSTTTSTGQAMARRLFPGYALVRFPADLSLLVRLFLNRVQPAAVVLIELEVWPNFLRLANRAGFPVAVVNGRITPMSFGRYRGFRRVLPQFDRITLYCAQSEAYATRFCALGVEPARVHVTGNIKVDGLEVGRQSPSEELLERLSPRPHQPFVVAGSTHEPEERMVAQAWLQAGAAARLVIVPRHPERVADVVRDLQEDGFEVERLTELRALERRGDPARIAIADTIGELDRLYALADLAFVGGSLVPHGGQNVLEPAAQGVPVIAGPHVHNFRQEMALLEEAGAAVRVVDAADLGRRFAALLADAPARAAMGEAGLLAVAAQRGATQATWRVLAAAGVLPAPRSRREADSRD